MKSFLEKSKRALVLLLTGAMIATSVPADVFAAPLEPDEDVIFEEGADAVEALGVADEEPVVEEAVDPVDPDEAKAEVVVTLSNHTGVQDSATNVLHAEIYDYDDVWASTALNGVKATSADVNRYVDPDKDYVLIVNPDEGLAFNEDKPLTVTGSYKDYSTNTNFGESKSVTATVTDLTPEEAGYYNRGAKKVTVSSEDLTAVLTGMHATDPSKPDDGILTLKFANPATAAKWKVSGFDLKDIEEKEHLSSLMNVTNNADYELDLSEVLSVGALNEAAFGVRVLVFNKDDVLVMDSGDLGTTAMDLTTSHTFPDDMKRVSGATTTGTKIWANYNESGHLGNLQIDGDAITYFYNNNYKLIVDVTANGLGTVKVKTTAASEALATFTACTGGDLDATNEVSDVVNSSTGASFDTSVKNKAFVFFVEKRAPYAYIQSVTWTVAGVTNKAEFQAKKDKWKVSIPNSDLQKGDITVEVKGGYSVSNFGSSSEYRVVDLDGKLIEQTGTESDLVFQCVPGNGKVVSGVTYTVGGGDPEAAELNTTDGTYTIKKEKITGNIQIIADTASSGTSGVKIVKLAGTYTGVTVKRLDAGNTTISASGTSVNTNDPLLFTVTSSTQKIEEVSYSMGSTTFTKLDPVYGSTYKIAAITAATTIKIVYQPQVEVFAPSNKNVTVNFAAVGKSAKVPAGAFTFTVAPVSENIKITKVSYNTTNALAATVGTELGKTGDTFNVTAGNTYYIVVETEETVDNTTYKAIFSDTTTPALITTSYAEGKAKTELNITEQELKLVIGDAKQTIVPAYKPIKSEKLRSALTGGTYTMTAPETTDILTFDNAVNQVKITPKKVGNQDVVVSYKKADGDYGNVLVYPGTLKVSVAQAYTDLEIKASMDTAYTYDESTARADLLDHIKLEFRGKDGQTGVYGPVSVSTSKGVKSLEWSFVPTIDTVKPADRKHAFFSAAPNNGETLAAVGTNGNSTNTAYVLAKEAESVTVKANIIFTDGSEQSLTKTLTFINPITETYFMTRTIDGAIHSFDKFTSASSPTAYDNSNPVILGLNTIDKKDLTVKYDYYRVIDTTGTYNTEAQIKKALTDGKIVKVDNAVIGTASVANMTVENTVNVIDKNSYATIETVDGGYKVTATGVITGKNTNHIKLVAPDVTINGVKIPSLNYANRSVTVWIANEIDRYNVELVTVDDQSKDAGGNLVNLVQTLSDAYIAGREFSKVTRDINSDHVKEQTGYEFTEVGDDSSFKLPEESDFATKPYSKKILLGWAETTYSPSAEGAIKATASLADSVLAPGTYVTITKDTAYKAIWADKYVKYTGTTATKDVAASSLGALVKLYDATKAYVDSTGKTVYPTLATTLEVGYDIPVVAGVAKVKGIKSGSNGKVYHTTNGVVVAELDVEEEFYTEGFTIAAKDENAQQIFDTNGLEAGHIKAKTTLPGTGVITAEVTDAGRTDITDKYSADSTVALTAATTASLAWTADSGMTTFPASPKITEGGAPATVTAALTDNGNAITLIAENGVESTTNKRYYNYSFVWTSSKPEIATVKAGNKTKQNVVTINPLAAGKTTITATVSKSGKEIATKNFELEVLASDITLEFADSEGHTGITEAIAHAGQKSTGVFKVKAVSKSGKNVSGGVFTFGSSYTGNKVIDGGQAALSSANPGDGFTGDANGYLNVPVITRDFVGTDTLHVQFAYTESGVTTTYQKDINIKTYYSVTLKPAPSTWITKNGTKQVGADGKTAVPVEIKLFEEDMKDVVDTAYSKADATRKKDFNFKAISLEGYSAIYNDGTETKKSFANWVVDTTVMTTTNPAPAATAYKENATIASLIGYRYNSADAAVGTSKSWSHFQANHGFYTLTPVMAATITLTGVPGEITMNYDPTGVNNSKTVNMTLDPKTNGIALVVKGEKTGFYTISSDGDDTNNAKLEVATTTSGGDAKSSFVIKAYTFSGNTYARATKTTWKAGVDTIGIYNPDNLYKPLASVNLYVNGLNYDTSTKKVQYFENGNLVKSDYKTVAGNTYYFDADGNWIETTGITKINGKSVLIIDGVVATKGPRKHEGNTYYVGDNGVIQTGWLTSDGSSATATNGVYYADPAADGKLVSGVTTIDGKKYVFGTDNKVSRASASANTYEAVNGYYVNAAGEIAENGIFKVAGVDRLFRENGTIVLFTDTDVEKSTSDVEHGTITLGGVKYIIEKNTNKAERDDILYNPVVNWTVGFPNKVTKGTAAPVLKYTITYASKNNNGATTTTEEKSVTATTTDNFEAASTATEVTFTATPDLTGYFTDATGATPATATPKTVIYRFKDGGVEGISDIWYAPTVTWTTTWPAKWTKDPVYPTMKYKVTYTSKETGTQVTTDELTATVTSVPATIASDAKDATFTATADLSAYYTDDTGATAVDPATIANATSSKKYIFKDGGAEGVAGTYSIKSKTAFTWGELPATGVPTASLTIIYTVTQEDGTKSTEQITTPATVTETTASGDTKHRSFKAVATTLDEMNPEITDTKVYNVKSGSGMEGLVIEGLQESYEVTGVAIQPAFNLVDYDIEDGVVLALGTDYTVKYSNNKAAGTGLITITGKGNYFGKNLTANFTIVDKYAEALKDDTISLAGSVKSITKITDTFTYDGTAHFPAKIQVTTKDDGVINYTYNATSGEYDNDNTSSDAKDVVITVSNNVKKGSATVAARGKDDKKAKTAKFKINALDLSTLGDKLEVTVNGGDSVAYEVKGVQPSVEAVYTPEGGDAILLVPGQDFKLSYKDNKKAGTGTAVLKGQKNCTKNAEATFTIDKIDLDQVDTDTVSVVALSGKKVSSVKPVVTDAVGNVIPVKAFNVSIYETGKDTALDKKAAIPADFDIKLEAKDTVNLENSLTITGLKTVTDFSKAKITVDKAWNKAGIPYTGSPIILTDILDTDNANPFENGKIVVKVGSSTLVYGEDFEVAGYANNNKKGNMTFTLYGIGNYAGSKSAKVKIAAKTINKIVAE